MPAKPVMMDQITAKTGLTATLTVNSNATPAVPRPVAQILSSTNAISQLAVSSPLVLQIIVLAELDTELII